MNRSALAMVNGTLWDMHKPLEEESTIELLHFHADDPFHVNRVFWRSCSFMLGYACDSVFSEHIPVQLHSFPPPNGMYNGSSVVRISFKITNSCNFVVL